MDQNILYGWFRITSDESNNTFSYAKRKEKKSETKLRVPQTILWSINDLHSWKETVFEEIDHKGNLMQCKGLEHHIFSYYKNIPVIVMDNHNHALYRRHRGLQNNYIQPWTLLIHIDQHSDMADSWKTINFEKPLKEIAIFVNTEINIGNFIMPAKHSKLLSEIVQIRTDFSLQNIQNHLPQQNYILDIDIDFWAPELDHIDIELKNTVTRKLIQNASLITVATSPYFIDQHKAIKIIHQLFGDL